MNSQKLEDQLNLALDATPEQREKSENLNTGYNQETGLWELIVKYNGSLDWIADYGGTAEPLIAGYAILLVPQNRVREIAARSEIEYVEKPKRLFYAVLESIRASCILQLTVRDPFLTGEGVLVAVIDSGIDIFDRDFQNTNGTTKIVELWDQSLGEIFSAEQINEAIAAENRMAGRTIVSSIDVTGHGTAVAKIAAGTGNGSGPVYRGIAPASELLIVKLGADRNNSFPRTTQLMRALNYVMQKALELQKPVAINLSFGNTYGSHDVTSLLERFIDNIAEMWKCSICVGAGNEGAEGGHIRQVARLRAPVTTEVAIGNYETSLSIQLWKNYVDKFDIMLTSPNGETKQIALRENQKELYYVENTEILLYVGAPSPYSLNQEIYFEFMPAANINYIKEGIWQITTIGTDIVYGTYNMFLPSAVTRNVDTRFLNPTPEATFTIPSTAENVITIGAYDVQNSSYADFSGRGWKIAQGSRNQPEVRISKPDIVAPGVNILVSKYSANGTYTTESLTGTSFATPIVTGSVALLMEWAIVRGNDPYLYGEKMKAYLISGATQLSGFTEWPNPQVGWGALCLRDSLPI